MKVAILGLGVDTRDIIPYLKSRGDEVTVLDEKKGDKFGNLDRYDLIVRSPGVYRYRKELEGLNVTSKTKIFFDICPAKIIGVTGTKGKGTTATLIYEILKAAGKDVYLGGNIGSGIFGELGKLGKDSWVVLELSSFQLIDLDKSPHIAVVLMVTQEHQDWHKDIKEYVDAKKNIVSHQNSTDYAVVNKDYPNSVEIGKAATGRVVWVSKTALKNMTDDEIGLRGEHNRENVVAAATAAKLVGVDEQIMRKVIKEFKGLEHRLEEMRTVNGITFYNDSFSTTPETAMAAIKAFTEPEIIILGGSSKNSDFSQLAETIKKAPNIKQVILIGIEGQRLHRYLKSLKNLKLLKNATMAEIVDLAYNKAKSGDVVLLSPACASFDMFRNYKDRGNQFKDEVKKL